jgi:hypothetical protein
MVPTKLLSSVKQKRVSQVFIINGWKERKARQRTKLNLVDAELRIARNTGPLAFILSAQESTRTNFEWILQATSVCRQWIG